MTPRATVLYEDTMQPGANGAYPLHDLVMRLVEDEINGETWRLLPLVDKNPRNGIGNLLREVSRTRLLAAGGRLLVLVDSDRVREHLKLGRQATEAEVIEAMRKKSDAPELLDVYFLRPNLEGLLQAVQTCDRALLPAVVASALRKNVNDRDVVFNEVKKAAHRPLRDCVRQRQPGLDGLARALAGLISRDMTQ